ncbi:MAG: helix-turn-helix domain-containing protein, partial [Actinomycetota bacterium]
GKSSLLRAGLIPALSDDDDAAAPPVALLTPGTHPVAALDAAGEARAVVVDQAEEMFTAGADADERHAFLARLAGLAASGTPVVLGLRADFYAAALREPELARALQENQLVVGPMTASELRRAIVEPARQVGIDVEEALGDVVLADLAPTHGGAAHDPGALPMFAHALYETWQRGSGRTLTVADYRAAGGIQGAIATTAERVHGELEPADRERARVLFLRLVHVAEDVADTRRRVEPDALAEDHADLLERFVDARLITVDDEAVQIAHEALITAWPRLRAWIDADRAGLLLHRELADAASAWQRNDRDPGLLLRAGRLASVMDWASNPARADLLNTPERAFLASSWQAAEAEREESLARTRRLRTLVAALTALVVVVAGVTGYAFNLRADAAEERDLALSRQLAEAANRVRETDPSVAGHLALLAYRTAETAEARSALLDVSVSPLANRVEGPGGLPYVAVGGDVVASAGDAGGLRLWTISDDDEPVLTEAATIPDADPQPLYAVAASPDGRLVAAGGVGMVVHVWDTGDVADPRLVADLEGPEWTVMALAFSPDGSVLAAASADSSLYLWDMTGDEPAPIDEPLSGAGDQLQSVAFSPDGTVIAAGCADGLVHRWGLADGTRLPDLAGPDSAVGTVAFRPDGGALLAGSKDTNLYTWEIGTPDGDPSDPTVIEDAGSWVNAAAWSPDGELVAAAGSDRHLRLYEATSGAALVDTAHPGPVTAATFLPGGRGLVTAAADGVVRLWPSPAPVAAMPGGRVFAVAVSPDDTLYVAGSGNGLARSYDISEPHRPRALAPGVDAPEGARLDGTLTLSPAGEVLATGTADGAVWLWDATAAPLRLLSAAPRVQEELIEYVAFSPDGTMLAAASDDSTAQLWDVADPTVPRSLGSAALDGGLAMVVAFSPDNRLLAVGHSSPNVVTLWDISDPTDPVRIGEPVTGPDQVVYALGFSPDGGVLAVGSADRTVRLLDISDPAAPAWQGEPLLGPAGVVYSVGFSPDGTQLAAASSDGMVRLWDVTGEPMPLSTLTSPPGALYALAFTRSGDRLAAGGLGESVVVWDLDAEAVADRVCALSGMGVSQEEWQRYLPSVEHQHPCATS